jgi:hypothetical protein
LPEQEKDGGDKGAGVPDTDPEDEVGDVPGPAHGMIQSPRANTRGDLIAQAEEAEHRDH